MTRARKGARRDGIELIVRNPVFRALANAPLSTSQQTDLSLAARLAFETVRKGHASGDDRDTLALVVNVALVLAEAHCSQREIELAKSAQEALLRADGRVLEGHGWGLDGAGLQAMRDALDMHEQQIAALGRHAVANALLEVRLRSERGLVHRVELVPQPEVVA